MIKQIVPAPPFRGLKVLDLSTVLAGPSVSMFFAELGATVIKIENSATKGDVTRQWLLPSEPTSRVGSYFASCNIGKRSLKVDLRQERDLKVVHDLCAESDICVASYKGNDAKKLKVCYETLSALNPRLIYAHITGYGTTDARPGYDAVIQAEAGFTYLNGPPSTATKMPVALMDLMCAHQLKEAILVALYKRERENTGSHVSCSLLAAGVSALANQASGYLMTKECPRRIGSDHPTIAPYGTIFYAVNDEPLVIAAGTNQQFSIVARTLGFETAGYETVKQRVARREDLKALIQDKLRSWTRADFLRAMEIENVPAGAVLNMEEVFRHPEAKRMILSAGDQRVVRQVAWEGDVLADDLCPAPELPETEEKA